MIRRRREEMQISEAELRMMTADMVEMHHATFPQMREQLSELGAALHAEQRAEALRAGRRRFVVGGGGLILGTLALSACGGGGSDTASGPPPAGDPAQSAPPAGGETQVEADPGSTPASSASAGDLAALKLNAGLENLAVFAYGAALTAAPKGMFGKKVPPAVAEFATHAKMQHTDHAEAFNAALKNGGGTPFTDPDPALAPTVKKLFAKVNSVPKLAMLALTLENTAAATYIKQMGTLTGPEALSAVATIAPVERQHAAILSFVLGDYPVPDTFVKLTANSTSLGAQKAST